MHYLDKRSQASPPGGRFIFMLAFLVVFPFVIISFIFIVGTSQAKVPYELEEHILVNKFLSSEECFAYQDPLTGEYFPLSVDISKFNADTILSCYPVSDGDAYALKLTLLTAGEPQTIQTSNWNTERGYEKKLSPILITLYDKDKQKTAAKIVFELQNVKA